ncbi:energy-coupling factor transporter ATPase [Ruminococcaceae bacterium AM28-23LB]|nr:energy-coupling factor transporter ATPase [Ruminococcaceae bacterium AM28-23LB]
MEEILRAQGLTYVYSPGTPFEKTAVDNVNLSVNKGEFLALIGHTGSGKSTLIQHFNALLKPTRGQVFLHGRDIWESKEVTRKARFQVGLVFQYPEHQLFEETIEADVSFGPRNMGLEPEEVHRRVVESLAACGMGEDMLPKSPFDLSGGQKRRVALAGVLAMEPEVLVLDEPAAGLDPRGRDDIFRFITEYHEKHGTTVIFVTHSMEDAARLASRIVVMRDSHVFMDGTPPEIFSRAGELLEAGLDVPQITRVFLKLREMGAPVREGVYTVEQAAQEILRCKKEGVSC